MVPKHHFSGGSTVEMAAWIAACLFNEGCTTILKILEAMGVQSGIHAYNYSAKRDKERNRKADFETKQSTKEARTAKKQALADTEEAYKNLYGLLYGPGIDDLQ